jgi:hypothetical protein
MIIKPFQQEERLFPDGTAMFDNGVSNNERDLEFLRGTYYQPKAKLNSQTAIFPKRRKQKWKYQKLKTQPYLHKDTYKSSGHHPTCQF